MGKIKIDVFFLSKVKLSFATVFLRLVTVDYGLRGIMG